jgi:GAF domain-containing protein
MEVVQRPSRLRALAALRANAESSADALDRITRIACRALDVPVALVNLVGADGQLFLGCGPLPEPWASMRELPLEAGYCPYALTTDTPYAFADARADPELAENPATKRLGVVAYAGVALRAADGEPIGTLCAIDYEPHAWGDEELALLVDLAAGALHELQLLAASRLVEREHARLEALETLSATLAGAATPHEVLDTVMRAVERTDAGAIWRVDRDDESLTAAATAGRGAATVAGSDRMPMDAALAPARVARTGEAAFLTSRREIGDGFGLGDVPDVASVALLPLSAAGRRLGVLGACFASEQAFPEEDREYLAALAGISGMALAQV